MYLHRIWNCIGCCTHNFITFSRSGYILPLLKYPTFPIKKMCLLMDFSLNIFFSFKGTCFYSRLVHIIHHLLVKKNTSESLCKRAPLYLIILQLNNFITELQYNTCANIASHIIRKYISHGRLVLSKYKFVLKVVVLVQSHLSSCWLSKFFLSQEVETSSSTAFIRGVALEG